MRRFSRKNGTNLKMTIGMNSTNNSYKQGDIIWVKYPFFDQPNKAKARPAVVVSHERSNWRCRLYFVVAIRI